MSYTEINLALASKIASGMDVRDAIEATFGEGSYEKIAGDIYDALRAKAA